MEHEQRIEVAMRRAKHLTIVIKIGWLAYSAFDLA